MTDRTFRVPEGVQWIEVVAQGGGAGGVSREVKRTAVKPGQTITLTIGGGGGYTGAVAAPIAPSPQ